MKFFSTDSPLYRFLTRLWDMIKLNFLWLVFSLPVVTMGAATVAAYSVTLKMVDEREGYVGRQFIKAFKENWKQGIPLGLIFLAAVYAAYLDFELFNKLPNNPVIFLIAGIVTIFFIVMIFLYAFPLSARYENTLPATMKTLLFGILIGPACFMLTVSGFAMYYFRQIEKEPGAITNPEDNV